MGNSVRLNDCWQFAKSGFEQLDPTGLEFRSIDLPHDWLIFDTTNLYENSIGWYRRQLDYSGTKHVFLYFEGVYMDCSLYVNGTWVGDWKNGYTSFEYEITEALTPGQNEILLKVVFRSPNSRWYSGAGIYRDVWLKLREDDYIVTDGIYVSTSKNGQEGGTWLVDLESEIMAGSGEALELSQTLLAGDTVVAETSSILASSRGILQAKQELALEDAELWSPENPRLYQLVTTLKQAASGHVLDSVSQNLGFKDVKLDPNRGLILNGENIKLNGVCEHHDLGALGAAFNKNALRYRFELLKEMGVNAIRTAHNVPAKALMDLADEMGFLIVSEIYDIWERAKTRFDFARFFQEWVERDMASWVRRDRNHPSLLMWSIGNEVFDTHAGERGLELTKLLVDLVRQHDPKGNAFTTFGSNYMPWENTQKCAHLLEAVGYNYGSHFYQAHHKTYPSWVIYGSETSSVVQSRGIYHFPLERSILADDDGQCSALGNSPVSWGAKSTQACLDVERETTFSVGQFIWTGFDYLGEPTPYHSKNSFFGQLDTANFPKDSFYIYQAAWTDYQTKPMIHLYPYWDFSPGQEIDIRVCSNAPVVVLEFNGQEIGRRNLRNPDHLYVADFQLPFAEGELKALAYDEEGTLVASTSRRSFGEPQKIHLKANKDRLRADGQDLIFVEISVLDATGEPVENASNRMTVHVRGAGRLVGLDNGDSTDYDQFKGLSKRLFSGKLMAILAASLEPGTIELEVSSPGLATEVVTYQAIPAAGGPPQGVSTVERNGERAIVNGTVEEIPVRKIELHANGERVFSPTRKEIVVKPKLWPENASYQDLEWRVVNDGGIDSKLAKVEVGPDQVQLTAQGDGKFRLRALSKNGTDSIRLFSELEFSAIGLGKLLKDPYDFVSGGLYDASVGEVGNGNERGLATARGEETQVGFSDLDFGADGSDTITIAFFALNDDPYPVQIWEGKPREEGSVLLADVIYQKPSKWNVYQDDTYKLTKRLQGITSLWIVTQNKMHIKGFSFEKQERAFTRIKATEYEQIYGDSYLLKEATVEEIGNNVTLDFGMLNFGETGMDRITFCGRTPLDKTMVQLSFTTAAGEVREQVEFCKALEYTEQEFTLRQVCGEAIVRLIFLPGSQFDLAWFEFGKVKK